MNPFTTEHPLNSEASSVTRRIQRRLWRGFFIVIIGYPVYLLLLGPLYGLNGRGAFNFIPLPLREACMLPVTPVMMIPGLRSSYDDYLTWWYDNPNAPDRETGWW